MFSIGSCRRRCPAVRSLRPTHGLSSPLCPCLPSSGRLGFSFHVRLVLDHAETRSLYFYSFYIYFNFPSCCTNVCGRNKNASERKKSLLLRVLQSVSILIILRGGCECNTRCGFSLTRGFRRRERGEDRN